MPRYKLTVEYDGRPFAGWQIQADQLTVQGLLTSAVEALSGDKTLVQGAGRTDAGVHARAQVAHADLTKEWDTDTIRDALNAHLRPHPIAILAAERAADDFNARTSAIRRHYLYRIISRPAPLALEARRAWWVPKPLDHAAMHEGAQRLVGHHDFTTFRSAHCQATSPVRVISCCYWKLRTTGAVHCRPTRASPTISRGSWARCRRRRRVRSPPGCVRRG